MFTNLSQDVVVTVGWWWCLAVALNFLGVVLLARAVAVLGAANPSSPLPWVGRAAARPAKAVVLQILAFTAASLAMTSVTEALGRRHLYDALLDLPFVVVGVVVAMAVQFQHNRQVRRGIFAGRKK